MYKSLLLTEKNINGVDFPELKVKDKDKEVFQSIPQEEIDSVFASLNVIEKLGKKIKTDPNKKNFKYDPKIIKEIDKAYLILNKYLKFSGQSKMLIIILTTLTNMKSLLQQKYSGPNMPEYIPAASIWIKENINKARQTK